MEFIVPVIVVLPNNFQQSMSMFEQMLVSNTATDHDEEKG